MSNPMDRPMMVGFVKAPSAPEGPFDVTSVTIADAITLGHSHGEVTLSVGFQGNKITLTPQAATQIAEWLALFAENARKAIKKREDLEATLKRDLRMD